MENVIRIGTRSSELALWQAHTVSDQLKHLGHETEIVKIDSIGDEVLNKPLYRLGTTGVFTRNLDIALLNDKIDIAVHSLKDVPTELPEGIVQAAVLKRGNHSDILVFKNKGELFEKEHALIATGSLRRKAQWLHRYPNHRITGLRGNVNTRLRKLEENSWDGAIFAFAGLKRIGLLTKNHLRLDWMLPAPAQGAVMVAARSERAELLKICAELNDKETQICVDLERLFLQKLEGGCSAPIGALAEIKDEMLNFKGALFALDGHKKIEFSKSVSVNHISDLAEFAAEYILERGGARLMRELGQVEKKRRIFSTKHLSIAQQSQIDKSIGIDMSDFITIRPQRIRKSDLKKRHEHVIITSQNAVESISDSAEGFNPDFGEIYCVGRRTKKLIESRFGKVTASASSASKLAQLIVEHKKSPGEFTFFCGDRRRDELPDLLTGSGHSVEEIICYQTLNSPLPIGEDYSGILFYSPSGVQSYLEMNSPGDLVAFCIGSTTAQEAEGHFNRVVTAKTPSVESLIKGINDYFASN